MRGVVRFSLITMLGLGLSSPLVLAEPTLDVSFKTTAVGGADAPKNVVAVWIQNAQGGFIKTIGRWAELRKVDLIAWQAKAGLADVDAISGATRDNHTPTLTATWDFKDKLGALVPDGIYTIRMELADENVSAAGQNNQGTFTVTKGPAPQVQSIPAADPLNGNFREVVIDFDPIANECNNNVVDVGETCDPPGSCPSACEASGDVCAPNELTGDPALCTAACAVREISECTGGDGCCPVGCDGLNDSDCGGDIDGGGCETGSSSGGPLVLALIGLVALVTRRRRS